MKRANKYVCDSCHMLLDPRAVFAVSISRIKTDGLYELESEYHFCPKCLQLARVRVEQSVEAM